MPFRTQPIPCAPLHAEPKQPFMEQRWSVHSVGVELPRKIPESAYKTERLAHTKPKMPNKIWGGICLRPQFHLPPRFHPSASAVISPARLSRARTEEITHVRDDDT